MTAFKRGLGSGPEAFSKPCRFRRADLAAGPACSS